ncbi:MAG: tetratricopeptide repeat protein [Candidatus Omnitrophota bacterium]
MNTTDLKKLLDNVWVRGAFLALVVLLCYSQAMKAGYIWDDDYLVTRNPYLKSANGLKELWFNFRSRSQYYPVVFSVFWVFYHLWELDPFGYHLANIILHIGNALLIWAIFKKLDIPWAYWIGFVFAVHPVHVESVAWVSELKNTLSAFFFLLTVLVYLGIYLPDWKRCSRPFIYASALGLHLLALFSKTVTCVFPVIMLIVLWWKKKSLQWKDVLMLVPFFLLGLMMGLVTVWMEVHQVGADGAEWQQTPVERFLIAGRALWFYLAKLALPANLIFTYTRWRIDAGAFWQYLYPVSFGLLMLTLFIKSSKWGRGWLAGLLYFTMALFPALGFFDLFPMRFSYVADHFQYLASIGPIALAIFLCYLLWRKNFYETRLALGVVFSAVVILFGWLTFKQTFIYKDKLTLFNDVIEKNPDSWMAYNNRGDIYFSQGRLDLAENDFAKALSLFPNNSDALNNNALIFYFKGEFEKAFHFFSLAIKARPEFYEAYGNRGMVYRQNGEFEKALDDFNRALKINPYYQEGYNRRAILFSMMGNHDAALKDLSAVIKIDPAFVGAYANRGVIYLKKEDYPRALEEFNLALRVDPSLGTAYLNRAAVWKHLGRVDLALADLLKARTMGLNVDPQEIKDLQEKARR